MHYAASFRQKHVSSLSVAHDLAVASTMEMTISALFFAQKIPIEYEGNSVQRSKVIEYFQTMPNPGNASAEVGNVLERLRGLQLSLGSSDRLIIGTSPEKRKSGVYFTPPRLADDIARAALKTSLKKVNSLDQLKEFSILDPAVGCGAFLLSSINISSEILKKKSGFKKFSLVELKTEIAKNCIYGVDIDPVAIATTRALVLAEVGNPNWLGDGLDDHLHIGDGISSKLLDWKSWFPAPMVEGFSVIVTNPPWSKLRPLRNEFFEHLDANVRLYQGKALGSYLQRNMDTLLLGSWDKYVARSMELSDELRRSPEYTLNGSSSGDPDLYKYFVERSVALLKKNGTAALLLPSGVLRAKGSAPLRKLLLKKGQIAEITEYINRKKIFEIHSMYRFTTILFRNASRNKITLAKFNQTEISSFAEGEEVCMDPKFITLVGGEDILIPEIKGPREKKLLEKLYSENVTFKNLETNIKFKRELDMTNHAGSFIDASRAIKLGYRPQKDGAWTSVNSVEKLLPVYEGRMIHQYNNMAKEYLSGHGRSAKWQVPQPGTSTLKPHYFVTEAFARGRGWSPEERVGFCEISGHANERTVLAAVIPPFAICGNKVPVLNVSNSKNPRNFELVWLAFSNSLTIDWIVRRWVSTTINQFYWQNIPFPTVIDAVDEKLLRELVARLNADNFSGLSPAIWLGKRGQLRAAIDAIVMNIFKISPEDQDLLLTDFPQFSNASNRSYLSSTHLADLLNLYRAAHKFNKLSLETVHILCDPQECAATYSTKAEAQWINQIRDDKFLIAV